MAPLQELRFEHLTFTVASTRKGGGEVSLLTDASGSCSPGAVTGILVGPARLRPCAAALACPLLLLLLSPRGSFRACRALRAAARQPWCARPAL